MPIETQVTFSLIQYFVFLFRSLESQLFNKANELQEDISLKRFDLRVAQIHLSAVRAQVSLSAGPKFGS